MLGGGIKFRTPFQRGGLVLPVLALYLQRGAPVDRVPKERVRVVRMIEGRPVVVTDVFTQLYCPQSSFCSKIVASVFSDMTSDIVSVTRLHLPRNSCRCLSPG